MAQLELLVPIKIKQNLKILATQHIYILKAYSGSEILSLEFDLKTRAIVNASTNATIDIPSVDVNNYDFKFKTQNTRKRLKIYFIFLMCPNHPTLLCKFWYFQLSKRLLLQIEVASF